MQNKTIKFFISSTFKDFIKERNALQNFVFPRLKKLCQDKGFSFQPVDLRWGVTNESSDDNKTMEYCLNEVKRCSSDPKPNLLILFGQRYGWVPLPSYIESNVFDIIEEKIDNINFTKELFEKEKEEWNKEATKEKKEKKKKELLNNIDEANKYIFKNFKLKDLLKEWYIKDLNDKNQKYYLKDKRNTPTLIWRFIEKILKTYIQKVDDTKEKNNYDIFHTSATEQEIKLALKKQKVLESKNTIVYYRKFKNDTIDKDFIEEEQNEKLEKLEKYLSDNKSCSLIKKDSIDLDIYKSLKDEYISIETKSHEEKNYPKDIPEYLEDFCESVYNEFKDKINTEIDKYNDDFPTTLKIELEQQERFLKSKYFYYIDERNERKDINDVIGRNKELKEIVNFITDSENTEQYYLLYGKSGTGKTSVMAKALTEIKNKNNKYDIYYRFIGTTAYSTYSRQVFESIYREIESKLSNNENLPKVEFEIEELKFKKQFQELLQRLDDKKVVIFLDAIDQFEDDNDLSILLDDLPKNIKIIFSVLYDEYKTDNNDYKKYYEKLSNIKNFTKLDILDQSFNIEILKQLLEKDNRTLSTNKDNNQQNLVESFIEGQTPLCVKLTYEIVREWTSNEDIDELKEELPSIDCENKEEELINKFFNNVIKKYYVNEELLNFTLGLISASKDGLSETELIDIISNEEKILKSYDKDQRYQQLNKIPDAIFSKMYYHIQDIFTEKLIDGEMLINPYHRVIEEVIKNYFYKINKNQLHKKLSDYFYLKQDKTKTWNKRYHNLHMLSEYPYQLFHSKQSKELKEILFDLEFAGSIYDNNKQTSFRDTMSKATQLDNISEDEIYPWESFYREKEHLILKVNEELWRPHQSLFQLAYEDGLDSPLTDQAEKLKDEVNFRWLKRINRNCYFKRNYLTKNFTKHKLGINGVLNLSTDKILSWSISELFLWGDSTDYLIKILNTDSMVIEAIELVNQNFVTSHSNGEVILWDKNGNKLYIIVKYTSWVQKIFITKNSKLLSFSSSLIDNYSTSYIYDIDKNTSKELFSGNFLIQDIIELNNSNLLLWTSDGNIYTYDGYGHNQIKFQFEINNIESLHQLPNNDIVILTKSSELIKLDQDGKNKTMNNNINFNRIEKFNYSDFLVWINKTNNFLSVDLEKNIVVQYQMGHVDSINGLKVLDKKRVLSFAKDGLILLWDSEGNVCQDYIGHSGEVYGVEIFLDKYFLSWAEDKRILLWHLDGSIIQEFYGHTEKINGLKIIDDKSLISYSEDGTIKIWKISNSFDFNKETEIFNINNIIEINDNNILSISNNHILKIYNTNGEVLRTIDLVKLFFSGVLTSPIVNIVGAIQLNNKNILCWTKNGYLVLFDFKGNYIDNYKIDDFEIKEAVELSNECIIVYSEKNCFIIRDLIYFDKEDLGFSSIEKCLELSNKKIILLSKQLEFIFLDLSGDVEFGANFLTDATTRNIIELSNEKLLSWSNDIYDHGNFIVSDMSGKYLDTLEGETYNLVIDSHALEINYSCILTWSNNFHDYPDFRMWHNKNFKQLLGHEYDITKVLILNNYSFMSSSIDGLLIEWNLKGETITKNYTTKDNFLLKLSREKNILGLSNYQLVIYEMENK